MGLLTTSILAALCALVFVIASWRASKPANPLTPRLAPWRALIIFSGAGGLLMLVHIVNLLGVQTGRTAF